MADNRDNRAADQVIALVNSQFRQLWTLLSGVDGAINKVAENIAPPENSKSLSTKLGEIDASIETLTDNVKDITHALAGLTLNVAFDTQPIVDELHSGFADVVKALEAIAQPPTPPAPTLEVKIVFKVKDDHADESFSVAIGGVTDAEGQPIPDTSGLVVAVASSDEAVVGVTFDPVALSGSVHFGAPGVASVTASVTNAAGAILGSGAADFTVTAGDPAAVSDVAVSFPGLTPEP